MRAFIALSLLLQSGLGPGLGLRCQFLADVLDLQRHRAHAHEVRDCPYQGANMPAQLGHAALGHMLQFMSNKLPLLLWAQVARQVHALVPATELLSESQQLERAVQGEWLHSSSITVFSKILRFLGLG